MAQHLSEFCEPSPLRLVGCACAVWQSQRPADQMIPFATLARAAPLTAALQQQLHHRLFSMSAAACTSGPTTATPPANAARGATADLADVFIPEPVDEVAQRKVNIMEPIFQCVGPANTLQWGQN